jgi:hypothetical protein
MPTAARRRIPPRQRHLAGHPATLLRLRHPGGCLIGSTLLIQRGRRPRLTRRRGRLDPLQPGDLLDQRSLIGVRIHRRQHPQIEHTFDTRSTLRQISHADPAQRLQGDRRNPATYLYAWAVTAITTGIK